MAWRKYLIQTPTVDAEKAARAALAEQKMAEVAAAVRTGVRPRLAQAAHSVGRGIATPSSTLGMRKEA